MSSALARLGQPPGQPTAMPWLGIGSQCRVPDDHSVKVWWSIAAFQHVLRHLLTEFLVMTCEIEFSTVYSTYELTVFYGK